METRANPMGKLYKRLGDLGLSRKFVRSVALPSWWDDEAASKPAGYMQALMMLSRHLGIDLATLRDETAQVRLDEPAPCKLKKVRTASSEDVTLARTLAAQVARLAALGAQGEPSTIPSALEIRQQVFEQDRRWVDLDGLVEYCWSAGIPVLHISSFPRGAKKMDGLAARVNERPVIVISKDNKYSAWLLFILAHELGHIALGHVSEEQVLVDERVDESSSDDEETEANRFALELLCGGKSARFMVGQGHRWPNAQTLAADAKKLGRQCRIDPGHIILNYAHSMGEGTTSSFWPVANAALKALEPHADAPARIRQKMAEHLDWQAIPEDGSEFIMRMTGAGVDAGVNT
ncbi:ImmA/IrrE family metallo-endopeptidase [Sorangium sp. So ce136]|uniref:ImmA/IrrE family metallo-endopeptidase n=1 Tax=Sorangium sp. So ce136 TaxID=3133284 RepID=UPI003F073BF2